MGNYDAINGRVASEISSPLMFASFSIPGTGHQSENVQWVKQFD
jgi:hypothetical protein